MKVKGADRFVFVSGRELYAHGLIIGISPDLELSYGYDGGIDWPISQWMKEDDDTEMRARRLTADDMHELADYMIGRWQKFRETLR